MRPAESAPRSSSKPSSPAPSWPEVPFGVWRRHVPRAAASNPTIEADVAKIKTDQTQLGTDLQTLAPTLKTDRQAIGAAITALSSTLCPLPSKRR